MAAKMFAEVVIAGSYKNLSKSTRGASKELNIFEKNAKNISKAVSAAFAGIALAGLNMLGDALLDMAKSAATDRKSMALLSAQMDKSWKATDKTKAGVEDYIDRTSNLTGILDDDLRPAFAKIVRVTKSTGKAQSAFNRILDISAGTGKDVNTVAAAYSKYLGGNQTALYKLIPGLKGAKDQMGYIDKNFKGLAETAGKNDPFARINVVFDNFKEKLGASFLPLIDQFATWLASDEAKKAMDDFAQSIQDVFAWFGSPEGQKAMQDFLDTILKIADAVTTVINNLDKLKPFADFLGFIADPFRGLKDLAGQYIPGVAPMVGTPTKTGSTSPVNITVNAPNADPQAIIKALKAAAAAKGIPMSKLLG